MSDNLELTHVNEMLISPVSSHRCPRRELKSYLSYSIPAGFIDISRYFVEGMLCDVFCENSLIAANYCYRCETFHEDSIEMGLHITRYHCHTLVCGTCHRVFQDFNKLTEFQPVHTSFSAELEQHSDQCARSHMFTPPPSPIMTVDADVELLASREGSQDYDMENDGGDVLLKSLEELEQTVQVTDAMEWRAETCQAEECRSFEESSKETRAPEKGPFQKLLTLLLIRGAEAHKKKMAVEEKSADLDFVEEVSLDAAPEFVLRSRRLRSGREF